MTGDEELRTRLARIDPMRPGGTADPLPAATAAEIQERVMQTIDHEAGQASDEAAVPRWRRPRVLAAAAVAVLVLGAGVVVATSGDEPGPDADNATTLALSVPPGDVQSSCVMFDVNLLREMPVAFAGTVTDIDDDTVTLDVDRWYKGGDADLVTVGGNSGQTSAALDGVDFAAGESYLLTATDGTVNGCGFSGPASAELASAFAEAFGG